MTHPTHSPAQTAQSPTSGPAAPEVSIRTPRRRPAHTRSLSLSASLIIHAALIALAGAIVWRVADPFTPSGPQTTITFDAPALGESAAPGRPRDASAPDRSEVRIDLAPPEPTPATPSAPIVLEGLTTIAPADFPAPGDPAASTSAPTSSGLTSIPSDFPVAPSDLPARPVQFAGLGASNARSVVYVVDCSGSMVTSLPLVIDEVERSVSGLAPTQKFGVVLFRRLPDSDGSASSAGVEVFASVLVRATDTARAQLHRWLAAAQPSGRSAPLLGLERALDYRPDAVFLLSRSIERSGPNAWDLGLSETLRRVDALNPIRRDRRPALIQTIQFLDDDPTGIMQEIGRIHGSHTDPAGRPLAGYRLIRRGEELGESR